MTDPKHPLTDNWCKDIRDRGYMYSDGLRAAYDKGFEDALLVIKRAGIAAPDGLRKAMEDFYA